VAERSLGSKPLHGRLWHAARDAEPRDQPHARRGPQGNLAGAYYGAPEGLHARLEAELGTLLN